MTKQERINQHLESTIELAKGALNQSNHDAVKSNTLAILHDVTRIMSIIEGKEFYSRIVPQPIPEKDRLKVKPLE